MGMTHSQIIRDLQLKKFKPVYFLCGEETYFIDLISEVFQNQILDESERGFGLNIFYLPFLNKELYYKVVKS